MENLQQGRPVNADKVIAMLSQRIAELEKEKAMLSVLLSEAQGEPQAPQPARAVKQPANNQNKKGAGK